MALRVLFATLACAAITVSLCSVSSCVGSQPSYRDSLSDEPRFGPGRSVYPNSAHVGGTIVFVDTAYRDPDTLAPRGRWPAHATLRIDDIYGYGPGWPAALWTGETLQVVFRTAPMTPLMKLPAVPPPPVDSIFPGLSIDGMILALPQFTPPRYEMSEYEMR